MSCANTVMSDFDLTIISLGAGVQSSTMYRMSALGELPKVDYAIFADTQNEPAYVLDQLDDLERDHGSDIPIFRVTVGNLAEDWFRGQESTVREEPAMGAALPLHLRMPDGSKGMASRSCTQRYKLTPIQRKVRELLGLKPRQRVNGLRVQTMLGISTDEAHRMKDAPEPWITNHYPLIEAGMDREACLVWLKDRGFPIAKRSACWHCPFHSNREWRFVREHPEAWAKAVEFDRRLRSERRFISSHGTEEGGTLRGTPYLHSSRVPLDEADLYDQKEKQMDFWGNECTGGCGL